MRNLVAECIEVKSGRNRGTGSKTIELTCRVYQPRPNDSLQDPDTLPQSADETLSVSGSLRLTLSATEASRFTVGKTFSLNSI